MVRRFVREHRANGNRAPDLKPKLVRPCKYEVQLHIQQKLCSSEMLQKWATRSCEERALLAQEKFGVHMTQSVLYRIYERHNVTYRA